MKWGSITNRLRQSKTGTVNHHFVFIEAPQALIAPEIMLWGEAGWWPKKCTMRFTRTTVGELRVGTRFEQKVLMPFGPCWDVEVTEIIPNEKIERTFLNGIFQGKEWVVLEPRPNGVRVDYYMQYAIKDSIKALAWCFVFERLHDKNIAMILAALKEFVLTKQKQSKAK